MKMLDWNRKNELAEVQITFQILFIVNIFKDAANEAGVNLRKQGKDWVNIEVRGRT